jgi:hypothetical protein
MTQTQPDRLDRIEVSVERITDAIASIDKKLDVYIAQNTEQMRSVDTQLLDIKKSVDTQLSDIKIQLRAQDTRLWGFIVTLSLAIIGFLSKLAFFPQA